MVVVPGSWWISDSTGSPTRSAWPARFWWWLFWFGHYATYNFAYNTSPVMQPGVTVPQSGGGVVSGSGMSVVPPPPNRESTYPVDAPMTWNDPPAIVAKKVV